MVGGRHRQVVVDFIADEQRLVLRAVDGGGGQHHVGDRNNEVGLSLHLHAQDVVVLARPGAQRLELCLYPQVATHRVEIVAHARRAAIVEVKELAKERRQVRDQRILAALGELLGHLVGPELVRAAAVARVRIVEEVAPVGLNNSLTSALKPVSMLLTSSW